MNPLTHGLTGWILGQTVTQNQRDTWLITAGTMSPDLDGLGLIAEWATGGTGTPLLWYSDYHHILTHNLTAGCVAAIAAGLTAKERLRTAVAVLLGFHLHLLEDIVGSGGPGGERWTIPYLWPWNRDFIIDWPGQWPIEAWPNLVLTFILILATLRFARDRGYSPLSLLSERADQALVEALRHRFPLPDTDKPGT